jgi:hypothetical protein
LVNAQKDNHDCLGTLPYGCQDNEMSIYPNPAKDNFTIVLNQIQNEDGYVSIFSTNGEVIKNQLFFETNAINIEVKDIPSGLYIVKVALKNEKTLFKKVLIQN